jgi:hypothetical protein
MESHLHFPFMTWQLDTVVWSSILVCFVRKRIYTWNFLEDWGKRREISEDRRFHNSDPYRTLPENEPKVLDPQLEFHDAISIADIL